MVLEEISKLKDTEKFLDWLVYNLIYVSAKKEKVEVYRPSISSFPARNIPSPLQQKINPQFIIPHPGQFQPQIQQQEMIRKASVREISPQMQQLNQMQNPKFSQQFQPKLTMQPPQMAAKPIKSYSLNSFDDLLENPEIKTIEAISGEKIKVTINNQQQELELNLNEQEIKNKINEFSEKTKIPAADGVFNASLNNFHINAVLSEIIPSRFLIQKD